MSVRIWKFFSMGFGRFLSVFLVIKNREKNRETMPQGLINFISTVIFSSVIFVSLSSFAADISVHDGDTFRIEGVKIRLWGIDAPELKQYCQKDDKPVACGKMAKLTLERFIGDKGDIECQVIDIDRYKRKVARCLVGGADIGGMMVRAGYAVEYKRYSDGFYQEQESDARAGKLGVWGMEFENPGNWRKRH